MSDPWQIVRDFEGALCDYTGSPHCVAVNSCTNALLLACKYLTVTTVEIPKLTYVGVPMSIIHAGGRPVFRNEQWQYFYRLEPYPIWDCARKLTRNMVADGLGRGFSFGIPYFVCVSFHWSKPLGLGAGGAILTNDAAAAAVLRRMRFDGRTEHVRPQQDTFDVLGYHCYMTPEIAAQGLVRLPLIGIGRSLTRDPHYADLSRAPVFKNG